MKHFLIALALMIVPLAGCSHSLVAAPSTESITMTNKQLVSQFFDYFSRGEIEPAFALVSDDVSWWVPGDLPFSGTKTKAEYMQVVGAIQSGFPDGLKLDATAMIAEGDKVAVEVSSYGQHVNGRTYENKYHFLMTIAGGEIVEVKEYMDTLHLHQLIQP